MEIIWKYFKRPKCAFPCHCCCLERPRAASLATVSAPFHFIDHGPAEAAATSAEQCFKEIPVKVF